LTQYCSWNFIRLFLRFVVLLLLSVSWCFAADISKQFDWNDKYLIQVESTESEMIPILSVITIRVTEKTSQQLVYQFEELGIPVDFFMKKMGDENWFFYLIHSGGESGGLTTIGYLSLPPALRMSPLDNHSSLPNVKSPVLNTLLEESPASFQFVDIDKDGNDEIVSQDMRFQWFEVEKDCPIIGFYAEHFDATPYFFPKIFTAKGNALVINTFRFKRFLQDNYLAQVETMLKKDHQEKHEIAGFIQYFYVSAQLGLAESALAFINKHNKSFQYYSCQNNHQIHTEIFDFIHQYQDKILKID
jgi:hypothetical protein